MKKFLFLIHFTKQARARFLAHRELMTLMERAVIRARLSIKFSEGFNPRPRISYLTALGVGIESLDEVIYLQLSDWLAPAEIARRLQEQFVRAQNLGINITRVEPILTKTLPKLYEVEYRISFPAELNIPSDKKIQEMLKHEKIIVERSHHGGTKKHQQTPRILSGRQVNIRPYINHIKKMNNDLVISIRVTQHGSARPKEVLNTLGVPTLRVGICKIRTVLDTGH